MAKKYKCNSEVWLYPSEVAAWHFVNVDKAQSAEIKNKFGRQAKGFGSIPVEVSLGQTKWKTSIFPDKKSATYLLPLKAVVRKKERVINGDHINFTITPQI